MKIQLSKKTGQQQPELKADQEFQQIQQFNSPVKTPQKIQKQNSNNQPQKNRPQSAEKKICQQQKQQPPQNIKQDLMKPNVEQKPLNAKQNKKPNQKPPVGQKKQEKKKYSDQHQHSPDIQLIQMLERDVLEQNPNVKFEDIAELDQAKEVLFEAVLLPLKMPQLFQGVRRPVKGVMLFGPPGTGKTMLAKAVATSGQTTFFNVSASSFASKWRGESEKLVRILFEMARFYAPSTIFFDEIDSIGGKRTDNENEASRRVKTEMLVQMDGVQNQNPDEPKQVMVLAATNRPWDLDEALLRRLERRIYIPLPTRIGRSALFKLNLRSLNCGNNINWEIIYEKTDGYSGADIANVCREAAMLPIRRKVKEKGGFLMIGDDQSMLQSIQQKGNAPLEQEDFEQALKQISKSVAPEYIKSYDSWLKEYGIN